MLHILYTQEEGGDFFQIAKHSDEETRLMFSETQQTGFMLYQVGDRIVKIKPAYIALVEVVEDYDFVLKDSRLNPQKGTPEVNDAPTPVIFPGDTVFTEKGEPSDGAKES